MSKTLNTIQIFAKIGKILSNIAFVFCIIGAAGCAIGLVCYKTFEGMMLGGIKISGVIADFGDIPMSDGTVYTSMIVGLICCVGGIVLTSRYLSYFKHELVAGTPFTFEGAKEMFRLGLYGVFVPIITITVSDIAYAIMDIYFDNIGNLEMGDFVSVGTGIVFLGVSFLCKYGAELSEKKEAEDQV